MQISTGSSRKSTRWAPEETTWEDFVERLREPIVTSETLAEYIAMEKEDKANAKDVGGFIGGKCKGNRTADNITDRQLLALDADYASSSFWEDFTLVCDVAAALYSTHSYLPDSPRYRLLIPLSRPVSPTEYEAVARLVAADLGIEMFDDTTYEPNRLMYWPSRCKDGPYIFREQAGDFLNPDEYLERYHNWHDIKEWPRSERVRDNVEHLARKAGEPTEKPGLIGAFCRVYSISRAISTYLSDVYREEEDGRYTFIGGTTFAGAKSFDDKFLYSWHNHDPYHGRLMNAFDLVRLHLYGTMDTDDDVPIQDRPSMAAMARMCASDEDVKADLKAHHGDLNDDSVRRVFAGTYTDQDMSRMVAVANDGKLLYHESMTWLRWTGDHWLTGDTGAGIRAVEKNNDILLVDAQDTMAFAFDKEERKACQEVLRKVLALRSGGRISSVERLLRSELPLRDVALLDPDPWALNTPGGIVDLRTLTVGPSNPEAMCTHITGTVMAEGPCPMWHSFLKDATMGDRDLEQYLQLVAGMSAVGEVYEEGLIMVYGPGGNGKSTMFGTLMKVLGDYATTIRSSVLMERRNGSEPYGLEAARGRRMVLMSELDEGARMSVSTMKTLTSRDKIQANPKFHEIFSFMPTHKLILHTNHLPRLGQLDGGTKRRIAIVPFRCPPKEGKACIPDLSQKLVEKEGPQILAWICEGAKLFWEAGCIVQKPEAVIRATGEYLDGEDWLGHFLEECCEVTGRTGDLTSGSALYSRYVRWAEENGEYKRRNRDFTQELKNRGLKSKKTPKCIVWCGIKLLEEEI